MPKAPRATWVKPRQNRAIGHWITRSFGEVSETTGRRKGVRNYAIGPPTGREGAANRAAAQRWVDGLAEAEHQGRLRAANPTLVDLVEMFCEWSSRKRDPNTVRSHAQRLRQFCGFSHQGVKYGDRPVRGLRSADLARFIRVWREQGQAITYINAIVLSVNACLNWAARPVEDRDPEKILEVNPFAGVERPRAPEPPKRYSGPEARGALLGFCRRLACAQPVGSFRRRFDRLTYELMRFCEATGCRPGEACRLEWDHVQWAESRAVLRKHKTGHATGKPRVIPLTAELLRVLRAIERLPGRHARFVFTHQRRDGTAARDLAGEAWNTHALDRKVREWRRQAVAAGVAVIDAGDHRLTLYAFRRDLGADVLRATNSYAASAEVLGHSAAMNEKHYSSYSSEAAVNMVEAVRARKSRKGNEG